MALQLQRLGRVSRGRWAGTGRAGLWTSEKRPRRAELQHLSLQHLPLRHGTALAAVMRRDGSADFTLGNTSWPVISAICPLARTRSNSARCRTPCAFLASTMTLKQVSTTTETCAILWKPEGIPYPIPLALNAGSISMPM